MIIEQIKWEVLIDGKRYGIGFTFGDDIKDHFQIKQLTKTISQNMTESLEKIIFGETDTDILIKKAQEKIGL